MTKVIIDPGVCGFQTTITVQSEDMQNAVVRAESQCPAVMKLVESLGELDSYTEIFNKFGQSEVFKAANANCRHAACPVPTGIIKGLEVECGLALPRDVSIRIIKE
jgi:hypothetical protein